MASVSEAIALARRGVPVFRLAAGAKDIFVDKQWNEGQATTDLTAVFDRFNSGNFNVGCWGGAHLLYIDVDDRPAWFAFLKEHGLTLPETFVVETPSDGLHYYFQHDGERFGQADLIKDKVNVRALGGYVVGPGSTFEGRPYRVLHDAPIAPLPDSLRQRLRARAEKSTQGPGIASDLDTPDAIERAKLRLQWAPPAIEGQGGDNYTFKLACDVFDYGLTIDTAFELMQPWDATCSPPWGDALRAKLENAWQYRQAAIGRDNPSDGFEPIELPGPFERGLVHFRQTAASEAAIELREWIAGRRLIRRYITGLIAPGGVGKSVVSIQWAAAVALGKGDFCGLDVMERTNVLIVNNEDPQEEMDLRAHAIFKHFGLPWEAAHDRISFYSGYGKPVRLAVRDRNGVHFGPYVDEIIRVIKRRKIGLVIFDPLISTSEGMDENGNPDMNVLQDVFKRIASETRAAVLEIHHSRKPSNASSDGYAGSIEAGRGASAIKDAWRLGLTLFNMSEKDADKYGVLHEHKHRFVRLDETEKFNVGLAQPEPQWYRRQTVTIENSSGAKEYLGVLVPHTFVPVKKSDATAMLEIVWSELAKAGELSVSAIAVILKAHQIYEKDGDKMLRKLVRDTFERDCKLSAHSRDVVFTPEGLAGGTLRLQPAP